MVIAAITGVLTPLALLACPVGMGLMMWMMSRGSKKASGQAIAEPPTKPVSLELLREEHRRLSKQIDRLEQPDSTIETVERP
ncbi:MAG: YdcH family protein [Solirubrobacteraceae bacterium]